MTRIVAVRQARSIAASQNRDERGYLLVAFSLSLLFLLGMCGLAADLGRMYVAKSEAQSFADAASLTAASYLAYNTGGFSGAATAATAIPKGWAFGTLPFTDVVTAFGTSQTGPFLRPGDAGFIVRAHLRRSQLE